MISAGFLNLLPGGSRSSTPPIEDAKHGASGDGSKPPKKVRCRSVEAYGELDLPSSSTCELDPSPSSESSSSLRFASGLR